MTPAELEELLQAKEGLVEFKEAKARFDFDELIDYCLAIANEGGGKVVFGVTDARPRKVVGTAAFPQPERTLRGLQARIPVPIDFDVVEHPDGHVVIFSVAGRPVGIPLERNGKYLMRKGDELLPMGPDRLRAIFAESGRDFSAAICPGLRVEDLNPEAVEEFRRRWMEKSGNPRYVELGQLELLKASATVLDEGVTYAALVLFGKPEAVHRQLAQAEIVFEYRADDSAGPAAFRQEFREGLFSVHRHLWEAVNQRNDLQHYEEGLFVLDIPTFDERTVREAILNAVAHRNYQMAGSIFIRQYPRRMTLENPGGLPVGITPENIIDRQVPGNRLLMDVLLRCGLVEMSGQGVDLMFERSIRQGKLVPDYTGTDQYHVKLSLECQVQDERFLLFLSKTAKETGLSFTTRDCLLLDLVHREKPVPEVLRARLGYLVDSGVVERIGRGRGTRYVLARRFYDFTGKPGVYTRKRGLDRATNQELLLKHMGGAKTGSRLRDLVQVLPALTRVQVQGLLRDLRKGNRAHCVGNRRNGLWFSGPKAMLGNKK